MPRKQQGWITFQSSEEERQILEEYCRECQRTKTDVLRELVRSLQKKNSVSLSVGDSAPKIEAGVTDTLPVSARNQIKGIVTQVIWGTVNVEVTVKIGDGVYLVSMITRASAERLEIKEGIEIYTVIKSNNVMLARYSPFS